MGRRKSRKKQTTWELIASIIIVICVAFSGYIKQNIDITNMAQQNISNATQNVDEESNDETENELEQKGNTAENDETKNESNTTIDLSSVPEYISSPYVEINNNVPYFKEEEYTTTAFEKYSEWDSLGRSGVAYANICKETMPKDGEEREEISSVRDLSGWVQKRYDNLIKDKYLYNRCHLIGWQLSAENANKQNLITGTRYLNTEGMLPFENRIAEYIDKNQSNHVLYRVTPIFEGNNLLASGVQMEAWSVEDNGKGICFNIYCYNVQPGIVIDYATGESHAE